PAWLCGDGDARVPDGDDPGMAYIRAMNPPEARPRVLIVEDEKGLLDAYRRFFAGRFEMALAANGADAERLAANFTPDVAVVDLNLPDTDGFEVVRRLRERVPGLPVVITTAFGSMVPVVESMGLDAATCLLKPFGLSELGERIDAAR
ncbi:MAG TPA: response regulator, partial [Gemmatimonadales bacterium]|nr:response regulator [Gemmatimonadales bacterium]